MLSSPLDQRLELIRPMKSAVTSKANGEADGRRTLVNKSWSCGFRTDGLVGVKYRQAQVPESEVVPKEAKSQETIAQ